MNEAVDTQAILNGAADRIAGVHHGETSERFNIVTEWNDYQSSVDEILRVMRSQ